MAFWPRFTVEGDQNLHSALQNLVSKKSKKDSQLMTNHNPKLLESKIAEVKRLLKERIQLHINDPRRTDYGEKLTEVIGSDLITAKAILNAIDQDELFWVSEVFEDISAKLQSRSFVLFLMELDEKYPEIHMEGEIKYAKLVIGWKDS
ncbi:MAG: hypothetical protein F6K10_31240 [Moorea sp. SIO2B7]|nr:hypothetical protein [Moorena sp. SIO2B7]